MTQEHGKTCRELIGRWGKKDISDQEPAASDKQSEIGHREPGAKDSRQWAAGRRGAQLREGFWVKWSEGDLEEDETPEPFRVGQDVQERVLGIGESDEISKILSFTGHLADERGLRTGASQGGYWSWPGVCRDWRCARLRLWILRILPV